MGRTSWAEGEILLASSTERIRDRLVARGEQPSFFDPIGKEVEAELLARRERLLDLTLAEFCLYSETAQELFSREPADQTLRLLVLSNVALAKAGLFRGFPECLFGSEEATLAFLSGMSGSGVQTSCDRAPSWAQPCRHAARGRSSRSACRQSKDCAGHRTASPEQRPEGDCGPCRRQGHPRRHNALP